MRAVMLHGTGGGIAQIDGYRVPECWNGRSFLAVLPSAE